MTEQLTNDLQGQMQYATFTLEDEIYAINVMQVQEVLREIEVVPVPGAPHYVTGIINLRGNVVSRDEKLLILVDLNKLLTEAEFGEISSLYPADYTSRSRASIFQLN